MSGNPMYALLDATAREGQQFSMKLFEQIDARGNAPLPISSTTTIVWNGSPLAGSESFADMLRRSPNMTHELTGLDVQPFPNGDTNAINMILNVSGKVKFGTDKEWLAFSSHMVVRRMQLSAPLQLQTMSYCLVHKPTNSTLET